MLVHPLFPEPEMWGPWGSVSGALLSALSPSLISSSLLALSTIYVEVVFNSSLDFFPIFLKSKCPAPLSSTQTFPTLNRGSHCPPPPAKPTSHQFSAPQHPAILAFQVLRLKTSMPMLTSASAYSSENPGSFTFKIHSESGQFSPPSLLPL